MPGEHANLAGASPTERARKASQWRWTGRAGETNREARGCIQIVPEHPLKPLHTTKGGGKGQRAGNEVKGKERGDRRVIRGKASG